jgi:signal peptidase I
MYQKSKKYIKIAAVLATIIMAFGIFSACVPKSGFEIGGNDKTISIYNMQSAFSLKLTGEQSENFITLLNEAKLRRIRYKKAEQMQFDDLDCVFLNHDSVLYSVRQDAEDENAFCIMTYDGDMQSTNAFDRAYTFTSKALAQYIGELEASAELPEGYQGEILNVGEDNSEIILTSSDGEYQVDMSISWEFKEITSSGSDDAASSALDYAAYSAFWGSGLTLYTNGSGITTETYDAGPQVYDTITWSFVVENGHKSGILYGNSSAKYILKFIGYNDSNPIFKMIDASGADEKYGADFVRIAELTQFGSVSDFETQTGVMLYDIHEIRAEYESYSKSILLESDILKITAALKEAELLAIKAPEEAIGEVYSFTLQNFDADIVTISTDTKGDWIEVDSKYYSVVNGDVLSQIKTIAESYIDFNALQRDEQIKNLIGGFTYDEITDAQAWWSVYPLEKDRVSYYNNGTLLHKWGPQSAELREEDIEYIADRIENAAMDILEEQPLANTDCAINIEYEDGTMVRLNASDSEVYLSVREGGDWTYIKVRDIDLFEYVLSFAGEGGIDLDVLSSAESVTIYYVAEEDRKGYPENSSITEIEVTDSEIVGEIAQAAAHNASPAMTYPSRENADIIFHTKSGDYYAKIKFPISTDENGMSEPTMIVEGHYWYSCPALYEILVGLE